MNSIGAIVAFLVGCICGVGVGDLHPAGIEARYGWLAFCLALATVLPVALGWQDRRARWCGLFLLAALLGLGRGLLVHPPVTSADLAYYNDGNGVGGASLVDVIGQVSAEPVTGDTTQRLRVTAQAITLPGQGPGHSTSLPVSGDMLILLARYPAYTVGQQLILNGKLTLPPSSSGFDYAGYLARHGVYSYMLYPRARLLGAPPSSDLARAISTTRGRVRTAIQKAMPEPEASLTVGVVTGDRTSIPQDVLDAFNRSGTTHILAISGQNISLLVGFVYLLYGRGGSNFRRRMPLLLLMTILLLVAAYAVFTGAAPSVVRAAIMSYVLLLAQPFGRRFDPISALAVSAAVMSLIDPNVLSDNGFLLSFAAMLGLAQVAPFIYTALRRVKIPTLIALPLAAGIGAQAATAPLLVLFTGRFSVVGPLATLTTEFALLPLMVLGIATGLLGAIAAPLGTIAGWLAWPPAAWMLASVKLWAALPLASISMQVGPGWLATYYLLLGLLVWWGKEGRRTVQLQPRSIALAAGGVAVWCALVVLALGG